MSKRTSISTKRTMTKKVDRVDRVWTGYLVYFYPHSIGLRCDLDRVDSIFIL